jgi:hypothetical protein
MKTVDDFWLWSREVLAVGLRANTWYNGSQPYGLAGYINDFSSRMIGYATMRQIRVNNSTFFFNFSRPFLKINKPILTFII